MSSRLPGAAVGLCLLLTLSGSCAEEAGPLVLVDVRTDLSPGADFARVETLLARERITDTTEARRVTFSDYTGADFIVGRRVAEFRDVATGTAHLQVRLVESTGGTVVGRDMILDVQGDVAVTVVLTRSCATVLCPGPDDPITSTACQGGRCVDPRCSPENPDACGTLDCASDAECSSTGCVRGRCQDGVCFSVPDDALCASDQRCDAAGACTARPVDGGPLPFDAGRQDAGPRDAGPRDAGPRDAGRRDAGPPDAGLMLSGTFCPDAPVLRQQMAVFLVRYMHGASFTPPAAIGRFTDVPSGSYFAPFIEQLARDGVTSGCDVNLFCPTDPLRRDHAATFIVRARYGATYTAPAATGVFSDVPIGDPNARNIEQIYRDGITTGCGTGVYCPANPLLRRQAAVFFIHLSYGSSYSPPSAVGLFSDVPTGDADARFIEKFALDGYTNGC